MFKIIAIILLAISTAGAGYFGWTQKKSVVAVSAQVEELTQKVEEADKKVEATEEELAASKDMLPPLMTKAQELEAVKAAFSTGTVLKDLEAVYAKEKKGLSPERQLGLAGVRLLTNGTKDPATVEAFQKALEMTDWKAQQKVICAAQNALAAAGQKHLGASAGQNHRAHTANATVGTCHQGDAIFQVFYKRCWRMCHGC